MPEPGEIYYADAGNELRRRVIVVSRKELNAGHYVVVVPVTSTKFEERSKQPNCVAFSAGTFGFTKDCVAQGEQILALDTSAIDFKSGPINQLNDEAMREVIRAIGYVIDADYELI